MIFGHEGRHTGNFADSVEVHYSVFIAMPLQRLAHKILNLNEYFH